MSEKMCRVSSGWCEEKCRTSISPLRTTYPHGGVQVLLGDVSGLHDVQEAGGRLAGLRVGGGVLEEGQLEETDGVAGVRTSREDPLKG